MRKKLFFLLLILVSFLFAASALAADSGTCGDLRWTLDDSGLLTITGTGNMGDYNPYQPRPWHSVKKAVISPGALSIGEGNFLYCSGMKELTIPSSVKWIHSRAIPYNCRLVVDRDSYAYRFALENGYDVIIEGEQKQAQADAKTVSAKVREIIACEITPDMSDYRKAVVLHNWLCRNCEYDWDFVTSARHSASGALLGGVAVCSGYADAYGLLLSAAGIENRKANGADHVWNVAKLDGNWVHIDVTWDDEPFDSGFTFDFFALTDLALRGVQNHENYSPSVRCDSYRSSQAYRIGTLQEIADSWMDEFAAHISRGETAFETSLLDNPTYSIHSSKIDYGQNPRMATQMMLDTGFTVGGRYYPVSSIDCHDSQNANGFYVCSLSVLLDAADPNCGAEQIVLGDHRLTWSAGKAAGCLTEGTGPVWTCSHCGQKYRGTGCLTPVTEPAVLRATGHTLERHWRTSPGCETPGNETYWQCTACGRYFSDEDGKDEIAAPKKIPAAGHQVTPTVQVRTEQDGWITVEIWNGFCTECEKICELVIRTSAAKLPGDASGDGVVDGRDAIRLMKFLSGDEDVEIDEANADVDLSGKVDEPDLLRLIRYLAGEISALETRLKESRLLD